MGRASVVVGLAMFLETALAMFWRREAEMEGTFSRAEKLLMSRTSRA